MASSSSLPKDLKEYIQQFKVYLWMKIINLKFKIESNLNTLINDLLRKKPIDPYAYLSQKLSEVCIDSSLIEILDKRTVTLK